LLNNTLYIARQQSIKRLEANIFKKAAHGFRACVKIFVEQLNSSPNPFSYEEKGKICTIFKVPLFLREGFRVSYSI
jgi:hypothetical protein